MSDSGDSGSLIMDMDRRAVGLLFAGSNIVTIADPIRTVIDELNIEFVHLLASLGVQSNVSNVFTFLAVAGESTSTEIEHGIDLRQAEVSIAMRTLRSEN